MEYTQRRVAYIVEAHNGRKWIEYARPYEEYLQDYIEDALNMGFPKVRYKIYGTANRWLYAYA